MPTSYDDLFSDSGPTPPSTPRMPVSTGSAGRYDDLFADGPPETSVLDTIKSYATPSTALRIGLPIAGGIAGGLLFAPTGPGAAAGAAGGAAAGGSLAAALGAAGGAALGGGLGEYGAEKIEGRPTDPGEIALAAGLAALPAGPAGRLASRPGLGLLAKAGLHSLEGVGQGALASGAESLYREGRLPTAEELTHGAVAGGILGGALGTGMEAVHGRFRGRPEVQPPVEVPLVGAGVMPNQRTIMPESGFPPVAPQPVVGESPAKPVVGADVGTAGPTAPPVEGLDLGGVEPLKTNPAQPGAVDRRTAPDRAELDSILDGLPPEQAQVLREKLRQLETQTTQDPLTGLGGARAWEAAKSQIPDGHHVVALDLKGFKGINDTFGHANADEGLKAVAGLMRKHFGDNAFRPHGDEFFATAPEAEIPARMEALRADLAQMAVQVQMPDGAVVALPPLEAHIGSGPNAEAADLAANAARQVNGSGRAQVSNLAGPASGAVEGAPGGGPNPPQQLTPSFQEWVGNRLPPGDVHVYRALREEYLKAFPNADREQFRPFQGAGKAAPAFESKSNAQTPEEAAKSAAEFNANLRSLVPDEVVEQDLRENVRPAFAQPINKAFTASVKPDLGLEHIGADRKSIVKAIDTDGDNPLYVELKEARRLAIADRYENAPDSLELPGGDASFDPAKFSVRPRPGQRGLEGIAEDVPVKPEEQKRGPVQTSMFGGEMLQGVQSRTTEGREAEGSLFTQERDARLKKEAEAQGGIKYATAFHGSPHDFDRFELSDKTIGTGEGAQAYGHGLYFAGKKEVAEFYRRKLTPAEGVDFVSPDSFWTKERTLVPRWDANAFNIAGYHLSEANGDVRTAMRSIDAAAQRYPDNSNDASDLRRARNLLQMDVLPTATKKQPGKLYEVDLAPDESDYLYWDKPLSEQSKKVQTAVRAAFASRGKPVGDAESPLLFDADPSGQAIYESLRSFKNQADATAALRDAGIPGIKYLDGSTRTTKLWVLSIPQQDGSVKTLRFGTRTKAEAEARVWPNARVEESPGSYNYVLFDDKLVKVKNKYKAESSLSKDRGQEPPVDRQQIGVSHVQRAFPTGKVTARDSGAIHVELPNGSKIIVKQGVEIVPDASVLLKDHPDAVNPDGTLKPGMGITGSFQPIGRDGIIKLAKEGGDGETLRHEVFHSGMALALTERERAAVLKHFGDEEAAADAYSTWRPEKTVNSHFSKILAFFKRIYRAFRPTWESSFGRVHSGEAFGKAKPEAAGVKFATAPVTPPQAPPNPQGQPAPKPGLSVGPETTADKFIRIMQDKFVRPLRYVEAAKARGTSLDFYRSEEAFHGRTEDQLRNAEKTYADPLIHEMSRKTAHGPAIPLDQLDKFLYAKHAPERNKIIADRTDQKVLDGSGMTDQEAAQILADFQAKGLTPKLDKLAGMIQSVRDEQIRVLLDGGLISKAQAQAWKTTFGKDYVPLRSMEVEEGMGTGRGFDIRGKEAKSATGRASKADSPTAFMFAQLQQAIVRAEKNKVAQTFADFAKANPDPTLWEFDKKHTKRELDAQGKVTDVPDLIAQMNDFDYKENGEQKRITIKDPLLLSAMKNMGAEKTGEFMRKVGALTRTYSAMVTSYSPEFILTNPVRDIQAAVANVSAEQSGKIAGEMVKNIPSAATGLMKSLRNPNATGKWVQLAKEFREDGGAVGFYSLKPAEELAREIEGKIKTAGPGAIAAGKRALGSVANVIQDANKAMENATRLSVYAALRNAGSTREAAASVAKNVTLNFNRKGEAGAAINSLYAFFNANVQGTKRLIDVAIKNPKGRAIAGGIVGLGMAMDTYNRSRAGDENDDGENDYDSIPEYVKDRNLVIVRGNGKKPLLFPMPYGFNTLITAGRQASALASKAVTPQRAAVSVASSLYNAFNPLGGEDDVVQALSPTFLDPIVQHATNQNFAGKPLRPEPFPGSPVKPDSEMYFKNVSPVARDIAAYLNKATGGDRVTPGYIDVSPETIQHFYEFASGGLGRFAGNVASIGENVAKGEPIELRNVPFARRFRYEEHPGQSGQKYRENIQELETLASRYKAYREDRNIEGQRSIPPIMLQAKRQVDSIDNRISRLRKVLGTRPDLQKTIDELQTRANRIVFNAKRQAGLAS